MIVRLRSRDGLERVEVPDGATVAVLRQAINQTLGVPLEDMVLSKDPSLLTFKGADHPALHFKDMSPSNDTKPLTSIDIHHGSIVHLYYTGERHVPGPALSAFDRRPFGAHMTVESMVAAQTRLERQENPKCTSVSFDGEAANAFQSYVQSAIAFSIKRGGILYGVTDDDNNVFVHAIFEPQQQGSPDSLQLERGGDDERAADAVATALGWKKVGWIYASSTKEREFLSSAEEICQMAAIQDEMGEYAVTAVVALFPPDEDDGPGAAPEVHFEGFQVSEQCVKLWREGWFQKAQQQAATTDTSTNENQDVATGSMMPLTNPKDPSDKTPVIVAGKDVSEVDADYFLVPVPIKDHTGPAMTKFPIENRLLPQGRSEAKSHMQRFASKSYNEKLADFHLLLWLARQPGFGEVEVAEVAGAVGRGEPVPEGYKLIIDSLAGL